MTDVASPPARIDLDAGPHLRWLGIEDAEAIAAAVGESLDHLTPWMPWANAQSAEVEFQRERIRKLPALAARGEEWQYGLFAEDDVHVLGAFGLTARRGPGTLEIGYWLHVDAGGHGYATQAAGALTAVARATAGVRCIYIVCDEANVRSAAVPRRLGFTLARTERRAPEAPGESGRTMLWTLENP